MRRIYAMKICLIAALSLSAAQPSFAAEDFDWRRESDQVNIRASLRNLVRMCVDDFGFTPVALLTDADLKKRLTAHLLLAASPDYELTQWLEYIRPMNRLGDEKSQEAIVERAADALIAADTDPGSFARAETLYVTTVMGPLRDALQGCERATTSSFIQENLFTGKGSVAKFEAKARAQFPDALKAIKQ
jgi:hypothetical protein